MFALCPHCQFLVTVDPRSGRLPAACPKCTGELEDDLPGAAAGETAADAGPGPVPGATDAPTDEDEDEDEDGHALAAPVAADDLDPATAAAIAGARPAVDDTGDVPATADAGPGAPAEDNATPAPDGAPTPAQEDAPDPSALDTSADDAEPDPAPPPPPPARPLPGFLHARAGVDRGGRLLWGAIAGLVVVLCLQLLLADRARLASDARWRPMLATLCGALGCDLPPWREPTAFTMVSRDVRAHPDRTGTLRVSASFRNDARWPQPWPALLLTLSDLDGQVAGARTFVPADYVDGDAPGLLAPGQSASVTLDVVEPAPRIVAFTFDFR